MAYTDPNHANEIQNLNGYNYIGNADYRGWAYANPDTHWVLPFQGNDGSINYDAVKSYIDKDPNRIVPYSEQGYIDQFSKGLQNTYNNYLNSAGAAWGGSTSGGNTGTYTNRSSVDPLVVEGYKTQIGRLEGELGALNPQQDVANARILNQYNTKLNTLQTDKAIGERNLGMAKGQVQGSKERSLKNLRDSISMQAQGYANQLGAFGAGDSSAARMLNFALSGKGSRERGNVLGEATGQLQQIGFQEQDLGRSFDDNIRQLDEWKQTNLFDITTKYQQARAQINNSITDARAKLAAEQNLNQQAIEALRQLEQQYKGQSAEMASMYQNALAPQQIGIAPNLQQYAVKPISQAELEALRMPTPVNPEQGVTSFLRRREDELLANPGV